MHKSRYVKVVRIAYPLTPKALPRYPHPKRPHHFTLPLWAARVRLVFYLDLSHRDREEGPLATDQLRQAVERPKVPDPTTWQRTFRKWRMVDFEKMKNRLLEEQGVDEEYVASDSTGFSPGPASRYDLTRKGRRYHRWAKGG